MFRVKTDNHNIIDALRGSLMQGRGMMADRLSDGIKYAGKQLVFIRDYMKDNSYLGNIRDKIQKNPTSSLMAIAGLGLIAYGIFNIARKR